MQEVLPGSSGSSWLLLAPPGSSCPLLAPPASSRSQEEPGGAWRSQEEPGGARRSQEEPFPQGIYTHAEIRRLSLWRGLGLEAATCHQNQPQHT